MALPASLPPRLLPSLLFLLLLFLGSQPLITIIGGSGKIAARWREDRSERWRGSWRSEAPPFLPFFHFLFAFASPSSSQDEEATTCSSIKMAPHLLHQSRRGLQKPVSSVLAFPSPDLPLLSFIPPFSNRSCCLLFFRRPLSPRRSVQVSWAFLRVLNPTKEKVVEGARQHHRRSSPRL